MIWPIRRRGVRPIADSLARQRSSRWSGYVRAIKLGYMSQPSSPGRGMPESTIGFAFERRLAALEPHRQVIGDRVHRNPLLCHVVARPHGDGVVLE
jgi:hypothetical protein